MKNYEFLNNIFKQCESAEVQAFKDTITGICMELELNIADDELDKYAKTFEKMLEWLKEEKE